MFLSICNSQDILKVMKLIKLIFLLIRIIVPIVLIVALMLDFTKAVSDSEALSKTTQLAIKKIIAAVLIFLIPTFVNLIVRLVDSSNPYKQCFESASSEIIENHYSEIAQK